MARVALPRVRVPRIVISGLRVLRLPVLGLRVLAVILLRLRVLWLAVTGRASLPGGRRRLRLVDPGP
jgi:hypothetical protein